MAKYNFFHAGILDIQFEQSTTAGAAVMPCEATWAFFSDALSQFEHNLAADDAMPSAIYARFQDEQTVRRVSKHLWTSMLHGNIQGDAAMRAILEEVLQEGDIVVTERESITILGLLGDRKRVYHHLHLASKDGGGDIECASTKYAQEEYIRRQADLSELVKLAKDKQLDVVSFPVKLMARDGCTYIDEFGQNVEKLGSSKTVDELARDPFTRMLA